MASRGPPARDGGAPGAAETDQHEGGQQGGRDGDQLRGGHAPAEEDTARRVPPEDLDDKAEDGIEENVRPENLALESTALQQPQGRRQDQEVCEGVVDL